LKPIKEASGMVTFMAQP